MVPGNGPNQGLRGGRRAMEGLGPPMYPFERSRPLRVVLLRRGMPAAGRAVLYA